MQNQTISVVIPVFNEELVIERTYERLSAVMEDMPYQYELLFVDDGSIDESLSILDGIADQDEKVHLISFSRNFGHQAAVMAGIEYAGGDAVVLIDADLQDPPEVIPQMVERWHEGYDVVYGKRTKRKGEGVFKKVTAFFFYRFLRSMTETDIPKDTGDFRLMDRRVCDWMRLLREKRPFVRGLVRWVGFKQTYVEYVRDERAAGETKYPLKKMLGLATDGIFSFSYKPLKLAGYVGFALSLISFVYLVVVVCQRLFTQQYQPGWTSLMAIILFFNGIILIMLGILGEYLGRIYEEVKDRPLYIVARSRGVEDEK
jgi:glycosyltransferase involved in cell wall biosynthesis